jgi:hypothetical protein
VLAADADYEPTERLVVLAIGRRMNADGICWPSLDDIARRTALSERTVRRVLVIHFSRPAPTVAMITGPIGSAEAEPRWEASRMGIPPGAFAAGVRRSPR